MTDPGSREYILGIIGIGNTLAGDDGAGNIVVCRLRDRFGSLPDVFFHNLETDPLELWDMREKAEAFLFIDAISGSPSGRLVHAGRRHAKRAFAPSLHQMDITTVMESICSLGGMDRLEWSVWGITISTPEELCEDLSAPVCSAVDRLVSIITDRLLSGDLSLQPPPELEEL